MDKIKPNLRDFIDFYNTEREWKVQLSTSITFISYINPDQIQLMHSKSDNVKTMRGVDANDTIQELISTFLQRYQEGLETKMKGSDYIFVTCCRKKDHPVLRFQPRFDVFNLV